MKTLETDVAIISAGTAGLAAAIAGAESGARVISLEKASTTGGTANMGMGPFAVESRLQKIKNIPLTKKEAFKAFMDYTHWRVDARLVSDYINKSADTIDWLEKMGVEFFDVIAYVKGSHFTHHVVKPEEGIPGPMCASTMMKAMTKRAKKLGVEILLRSPVEKIIKEDGKITGLMAEDQSGEPFRVNAGAVIIATGGFGDNPAMIKKHTGYEWGKDIYSMRVPGMTGDGIRMAWAVGAGKEGLNMELTCSVPSNVDLSKGSKRPDLSITAAFKHPNLMVNLNGERFINEGEMGNPTFLGNAVARQKNRCAFNIVDDLILKNYEQNGLDWLSFMHPDSKVGDLINKVEMESETNDHVFTADSIEELCEKTGIDSIGLKKTIGEYNCACETGRDDIFYKDAKYLKPIKGTKYFAGRYFPTGYGSLGGVKINHKTEVLTKDQDVIPGLYAAGIDSNAIYADSYIFIFPGNSMGFALNSGRIAGENAAAYIKSINHK